ncbi:NUDIX domain-containing protein [Planococcus salinus]|uniref:NUDIX domain-containing protein n=1 Tax=Planococcus salinus TaxID=1848460 RepID=A0A3M8P3P3_9BACL|nr:NUDIX domain-containing protein [Planococcus salinus]RNF38282.1 NUDIX domain-containing protein [Planococcus salinus]
MEYTDLNGFHCSLSFEPGRFSIPSKHVLVICRVNGNWLLTEHPLRGLEFPGGKMEQGERLLETATREVYEETGAIVTQLEWFAEYLVNAPQPFCKTVFTGKVEKIDEISPLETKGVRLVQSLELDGSYSFLMKDEGMKEIIKRVKQLGKWKD